MITSSTVSAKRVLKDGEDILTTSIQDLTLPISYMKRVEPMKLRSFPSNIIRFNFEKCAQARRRPARISLASAQKSSLPLYNIREAQK